MVAWLITMVPGVKEEIITILNYRLSQSTVGAIMERLYIERREGLIGQLEYAKTGKARCPWKSATIDGIPYTEELWCGSGDRVFWARKVDKVKVTTDQYGHEKLVWAERERPDFSALRKTIGLSALEQDRKMS